MATIKLTLGQIYEMTPFFISLENNLTLNFSTRRKLIKFNEKLSVEFEIVKKEIKQIIENYCEKDSEGKPLLTNGNYTFPTEKIDEVNKKIFEVEQEEVEIDYSAFTLIDSVFDNFNCGRNLIKIIGQNFLIE